MRSALCLLWDFLNGGECDCLGDWFAGALLFIDFINGRGCVCGLIYHTDALLFILIVFCSGGGLVCAIVVGSCIFDYYFPPLDLLLI